MISNTLEKKHCITKKEFVAFLKNLGIDTKTNTYARGHQGFFRENRIDVSKALDEERQIQVLAHEFAHYIHAKLEPKMPMTGGSLKIIFNCEDVHIMEKELLAVTTIIDKSLNLAQKSKSVSKNVLGRDLQIMALSSKKHELSEKIKELEKIIKNKYPNYAATKEFKEFKKYIKGSKARYFLKYDRVKFITPFLRREEIYCISEIEKDFPAMPREFVAYIRMLSLKRSRARISRRINKYKNYYTKPSELFARFVESFFVDESIARQTAPLACERFFRLLNDGYYFELKKLFDLCALNTALHDYLPLS